tara:strand:+ start:203 stop:358 length:156 start_codon:yes stop_codon:yes gene_type:complete
MVLPDELNNLQHELDCHDEIIYAFMEAIRNRWLSDICHSQVRKIKREGSYY